MPKSHSFLHNLMKPFKFGSSNEGSNEEELERIAAQEQKIFPYETLVAATKNFHAHHKLGEGGFGPVYKGVLDDGREIAVRKLSGRSSLGIEEFMNGVMLLARVHHQNVVSLLGYCVHGVEKLLVYEYVRHESLDKLLFSPNGREQELDWSRTYDIIIGIARGLSYLHCKIHIIHCDITPSNILLDHKWLPKISDLGNSWLFGPDQTEDYSTKTIGTWGYMAPEYAMHGRMSMKVDVFSFGVLLLGLISGKGSSTFWSGSKILSLIDWAYKLYEENRSLELLDPTLADSVVGEQVTNCIIIGLLCVQDAPDSRPSMDRVVSMLIGNQGLMGMQIDKPGFFERRSFASTPSISSTLTPSISVDEETLEEALEELRFQTGIFNDVAMNSSSNSNQIMEEDSESNSLGVPAQDGRDGQRDEILRKKIDAQNCQRFSYETLHDATNGFAFQNVLGHGGFGLVYKGKVDDGREIAVKKSLNMSERKGEAQVTEVELLSSLKHPNVVKLFGYCDDNNEFLLVYEYVPNKSLDKLLFGPNGREQELDWSRTYGIIIGIARGLSYLHNNPQNRIIHRDIKPGNILLNHKWVPKISDFGVSRLFEEDQTHVHTRLIGTCGYMAPEYVYHSRVSIKTDVYSFGVLVLELISGRKFSFEPPPEDNAIGLLDWAYKLFKASRISEIMDPALTHSAVNEQVKKCIEIGLRCTQSNPNSRADMERCVSMLIDCQDHREISITRPGILGYGGYLSGTLSEESEV